MIYLCEDDENIRKLVIYALNNQGYDACGFDHPSGLREALLKELPELLLLDIMLPDEDGISLLTWIRQMGWKFPVIMLTAKNTEFDKVQGLDAGADDYISKPFGIMELMARIRAVLRRTDNAGAYHDESYDDGVLRIDTLRHEVTVNGKVRELTFKEYQLLKLLMKNAGRVLTREILFESIWGEGMERENRTLDVHIRTLRAKLGEAGDYIQTVRSVGYRFKK